ncbi:hypothetical protein D9M71_589850 [compost metagenome]
MGVVTDCDRAEVWASGGIARLGIPAQGNGKAVIRDCIFTNGRRIGGIGGGSVTDCDRIDLVGVRRVAHR